MIGIDIISISRIEKSIEKFGSKAKNRFMTQNEQSWAKKSSSIAGIWASKEAFSKAIGTGIGNDFSFLDIEIYKNSKGKPLINILNQNLKQKLLNKQIDISITHDGGFAIAAVIIL
jgi:holo-[acyl-carrier protein] synthase